MMLGMVFGRNARLSSKRLPRMRVRTTYQATSVQSSMVTVGAAMTSSSVLVSAVAPCGLVKIERVRRRR